MDKKEKKSIDLLILYRYLFETQKKHYVLLSVLILTILITVFCDCVVPLIFKKIFGIAVPHANIHILDHWLILLFALFFLSAYCTFVQARIASNLGAKMISLLRLKLLNFIQQMNIYQVDKENVLPRISEDTSALENSTINSTWITLRFSLTGFISFILLFYLNWRLAILVVLFIPITIFFPKIFLVQVKKYVESKKIEEDKLLSFAGEEIAKHNAIYILRLKNYRRKLFKILLKKAYKLLYLYNTYLNFAARSAIVSTSFIIILILGIGAYLIVLNLMDIGELIGFISLVSNLGAAVSIISDQMPILISGSEALTRIERLLSSSNRPTKGYGFVELNKFTSEISFKDVSFKNKGVNILSDINLTIPVNKMIALVGLSGSGKTSILNLLLRHYSITDGAIKFDDIDIQKSSLSSLLKQFGVVEQQPTLFSTTIKENILFGKLNATDEEIIEAAKRAEIHEDIMALPQGYDTHLKDVKLSGGQQQRIVIARALISNPAILCLDEATSALDPITESHLNETIKKMKGLVTIISCTHRLRSIVDAEQIYVLEKGYLVETGKHQDLLRKKGKYYNLWEKQSGVELSEDMRHASIDPQWLKQISLFKNLDVATLDEIAHLFSLERKDTDQIIFSEGNFGDKFYIIVAGVVEVSYFDKNTKQKKVIATLSDGDYFGEIALLYNRRRNATITTKGVCILLTLNYQQYYKVFAQLPEATQKKIREIAEQHSSIIKS